MALFFFDGVLDPFTARDLNGNPVAGALLNFYKPGTLEAAVVYSDQDLTTPIVQPMTADGDGEFSRVWLDPEETYRARVVTPGGVLLLDVDDYVFDTRQGQNVFRNPRVRALLAGVIVPGATLAFYITETSTPTPVYADAGLETPLPNPVVADASGRFPPIYLDTANITYRVVPSWADEIDPYLPILPQMSSHGWVEATGLFAGRFALQIGIPIETSNGLQTYFSFGELMAYWLITPIELDGEAQAADGTTNRIPGGIGGANVSYFALPGEWIAGTPDPEAYEFRLDVVSGQAPAGAQSAPVGEWLPGDDESGCFWDYWAGDFDPHEGAWRIRVREASSGVVVADATHTWSLNQ